jgi:hypothetical protein
MVSAAPQSAQNFLPGGFSAPHAAQRTGKGVPQPPQNFFPSKLAAPQLGHFMPHPIDWIRAAYHSLRGPPSARMKSVSAKRARQVSRIGPHRQCQFQTLQQPADPFNRRSAFLRMMYSYPRPSTAAIIDPAMRLTHQQRTSIELREFGRKLWEKAIRRQNEIRTPRAVVRKAAE